jgi:hypothetical protein
MKRIWLLSIVFVCLWLCASYVYAQDGQRGTPQGRIEKEAPPGRSGEVKAVRSRGGHGFVGIVLRVDPEARTILVRGGGKTVSFDVSNPILKGYRSLGEIKKGSYVSLAYTANAIRIGKSSRAAVDRGEYGSVGRREGPTAGKNSASKRMRVKTKGDGFNDIDENKDGRVSAVELSAVVKDLSLKQFKEYDKDGDGCLSESEFRAVVR